LMNPLSHVLQVITDLGRILTGVKHGGTCHVSNVDPHRPFYPVGYPV
jgi:hypothetical protein